MARRPLLTLSILELGQSWTAGEALGVGLLLWAAPSGELDLALGTRLSRLLGSS